MTIFGVQVSDITDAIGAIREAGGTLKDGITIAKKIRDQVRNAPDAAKQEEIVGLLGSLSEKLADVQVAHLELVDRLHQAETSLRDAQAKRDEAERYKLVTLSDGGLALELKADDPKGEPPHFLCQACFDDGKKRIMQPSSVNDTLLVCPGCKQSLFHRSGGNGGRLAYVRE